MEAASSASSETSPLRRSLSSGWLLLVFFIFLTAHRDRNRVEAATSSELTTWTGDQDDAIALALASNMTATELDVSEMAIASHRCHKFMAGSPPFGR